MRDRRDHSQLEAESAIYAFRNMIQTFTCFQNKNSWVGSSCGEDKTGNVFYKAVEIDEEIIEIGDFVFIKSTNPSVPKQVNSMNHKNHESLLHTFVEIELIVFRNAILLSLVSIHNSFDGNCMMCNMKTYLGNQSHLYVGR